MENWKSALGAFFRIRTPNTGQLNSLFHTFAEFRPISGLPRYNPIYYWLAVSAQYSTMDLLSSNRRKILIE